jgi:protein O-GlcNAc transferase
VILRLSIAVISTGLLLAQQVTAPVRLAPVETAWDLLRRGERKEAVRTLNQIVEAQPGDADARLLLGSILAEDHDRAGAIAQLTEAVRLRPQSAEAHNALGEAFNGFGETRSARGEFEKAVALDPAFAQAQVNLGQVLMLEGKFGPAAQPLDHALHLFGGKPDAAYAHYLRAKVNTDRNEIHQAAEHLTAAVLLQPDFAEAWSDLGEARKTLGDSDGALTAFEKAVAAGPEDAVAQYRLGSEYFHRGEARLALPHLQKALALNPEDQSTLYVLQSALRHEGQLEQASRVKEDLAELLRKRDQAAEDELVAVQLNNQGAAFEKAGNLDRAIEKYRAALALAPEHVGFRVNFAAALLRVGNWREGTAELKDALRRDPENMRIKAALDDALRHAPQKSSESSAK